MRATSHRSVKKPVLCTIGHSTRSTDEFIELLRVYGIKQVVDVRKIPRSRHNPQFNEADIKRALEPQGIRYTLLPRLGGLRHARNESINLGWRNRSFRGFADYMSTVEFNEGLDQLMVLARGRETAIMCAEAVPWRCHRSLIADALTKKGWIVRNIMSVTSAPRHKLTSFLKVRSGQLVYPAPTK